MPFFRYMLLIFILVPIVEIYFLIKVGDVIGALPTVLLVVFTAFLGVFLLRWQGLSTLYRVQTSLAQGELPAGAMVEGLLLLVAGALLLTPGFVTDTIGFTLLVPPLRQRLAAWLILRGLLGATGGMGPGSGPFPPPPGPPPAGPRTIEGEYKRHDD